MEEQKVRRNRHPFILVAGFSGWGRDEIPRMKYWGGRRDIEAYLSSNGYTTYTAATGPISSNWDRACELYAFIKGGTVDYGKAHADMYGHARFGPTYPGVYPEWGERDERTGRINRVHLIGHSMGGQTIRLLAQLLADGSEEERSRTAPHELSPLFAARRQPWIHSITTISTPHDGTTLANAVDKLLPHARRITAFFSALTGTKHYAGYQFKLDHWGLKKKEQESFDQYVRRIAQSRIWQQEHDISFRDVHPEGARELNGWVKAQPDIYYLSYGTKKTVRAPLTGHELPRPSMNPLFISAALFMGAYRNMYTEELAFDHSWWANDGVVNTISMNGPKLGSTDRIVPYNGMLQRGVWNDMGIIDQYDHLEIVGFGRRDIYPWYLDLVRLLASLPE